MRYIKALGSAATTGALGFSGALPWVVLAVVLAVLVAGWVVLRVVVCARDADERTKRVVQLVSAVRGVPSPPPTRHAEKQEDPPS